MKKLYWLSVGTALLFAGCTNDLDEGIFTPSDGTLSIEIEGRISQTYTTRVDDGGFCDGDQIGLFGVNYTDKNTVAGTLLDEGNQVDNARYTFDEANWVWKSQGGVYYKDAETNIDLYGYYPYGAVNSVSEYAFEVQQDQSGGNAVDGYALSDFLWGKATNIAPSEAKVKIKFNHKMACANVVLKEGEGFAEGEFATLPKSVLVMNTTRTSTIDLATGEVTAVGDAPMEGIVMKSNNEGYKAIVVPQIVTAGTALFSITVDGIAYRFKKDIDFAYEAGKQSKFTIEINKKSPSGEYEFSLVDCEIVDWIADLDTHGGEARQYYVVHQEEPGTLSAKLRAAKKDPTKIKNLKISGKIDACDFYFMRDSMDVLQAVNLKESQIEATTKASWYNNGRATEAEDGYKNNNDILDIFFSIYHPSLGGWGWSGILKANEIPIGAFYNKITLTEFSFPETITTIGTCAFAFTPLSGALVIPDSVSVVEDAAFDHCSNITSVSLPLNLVKIGMLSFNECSSMSGCLALPNSCEFIGYGAFLHCSGLTGSLILPDKLKYLDGSAFGACSGFTGDLSIPASVDCLYGGTFSGCSGLNGTLILHDNLKLSNKSNAFGYDNIGQKGGQFLNCSFQGELVLPVSITTIPPSCFQGNLFSSISEIPEWLIDIGESAFAGCWRLSGVLEFPASLSSIRKSVFWGCSTLEGIILSSNISSIQEEAFAYCYYLNKIISKSIEPPTILSGAFDGVAKDNFVVEVPEQSINRYQSDIRWGEFKRIGAYHDFSISRREMRVLNAEHGREFVLRAPADLAWSIESQPDWCTITPSSGIGKQNVVVTVNKMTDADVTTFEINTGAYNSPNYETHAGRAGEIVFLLNDRDYRTTLKVEQYDADVADGQIIVNQTASIGNGVNLVFMGDCFDARDIAMGSYLNGINEAIGYYFDIEPYKTYKDYFNVYTVVGMSNDSGMGTVNTIRDAKFGSQYTINAGVAPNESITFEYAMTAPTVNEENLGQTLVVMIENTTEYGGVCYMWGDGSAIACCPMSDDAYPYDFRGIVQHEAGGHGFGKLGDEYIYHNGFISACPICGNNSEVAVKSAHSLGWYRNLSLTGNMDEVAWSHLIFHPNYSNIVDVYEGGYMHSRGCFRSEPNSCMNNNIPYYSAISRQEIVERIKRYAGEKFDLNEFYANDVLDMQGNITGGTRSIEENAITLTGAGKQMPPKFMGDKPQLKKSNK